MIEIQKCSSLVKQFRCPHLKFKKIINLLLIIKKKKTQAPSLTPNATNERCLSHKKIKLSVQICKPTKVLPKRNERYHTGKLICHKYTDYAMAKKNNGTQNTI